MPVPLPGDFTLRLAPDLRRPRPEVLIGGAPVRVLRLAPGGAALVDEWSAGRPVGPGRAAGTLAARLVEAGMASPSPPGRPGAAATAVSACVVIPVRDDPAGLAATLAALGETAPGVPVVVVDDGSSPAVSLSTGGSAAEGVPSVVRRATPGGPAAARNTGAGRVPPGTDVVVFVDAGCVPEDGWLDTLLAAFADPGLAAVAPRVRSRALPGTPPAVARYEKTRSPLDLGPTAGSVRPFARVSYVPSAVLAVRAGALRRARGFDEELRFGEDVDLVWRLVDDGWRVRYDPAATATHPARAGVRSLLRQRFDYGRSATPLARRHGRKVAPLTVSPWSVAAWSLVALGRPLPAVAIAVASAETLARRAGADAAVATELRRLAAGGTIRAAGPMATAIRRAWLPPAVGAWIIGRAVSERMRRRRLAWRPWGVLAGVAILAGPGLADWWAERGNRPSLGPWSWIGLRLADDLAYQSGVWAGAVSGRSAGALLPRW